MSSDDVSGVDDTTFFFPEDGQRPAVRSYGTKQHVLRPNDQVIIRASGGNVREGPYHIEKCTDGGKYTLCDEDGKTVKEGKEFEEGELEVYDPFA
ncbi:hypothetical protein V8F06_007106 [Rhypophila decipiens]